jgi:aspartokinase/homoserine dehydrogenase 1
MFCTCLRGIDLYKWKELHREKGEKADLEKFVHHVHGNHFLPNRVLGDCTSSTDVADHYHDWLDTEIHVITQNKKAN